MNHAVITCLYGHLVLLEGGGVRGHMMKKGSLAVQSYGQDAPLFSTPPDVDRFNVWLRSDDVFGALQKRMVKSFGQGVPAVDCWVFVEYFQSSFLRCLEMYEHQGGWVDWNSKMVGDLVATVAMQSKIGILNQSHARKLLGTQLSVGKNNITSNPQLWHHGPCNIYFNESTKRLVEAGPDSIIYKYFQYEGCCSKESGWAGTKALNSVDSNCKNYQNPFIGRNGNARSQSRVCGVNDHTGHIVSVAIQDKDWCSAE